MTGLQTEINIRRTMMVNAVSITQEGCIGRINMVNAVGITQGGGVSEEL